MKDVEFALKEEKTGKTARKSGKSEHTVRKRSWGEDGEGNKWKREFVEYLEEPV